MKVKQLVSLLKKMPQDLDVWVSDMDHGRYEVNGQPTGVRVIDKSEIKEAFDKRSSNEMTPQKYVNIRL